MPPVETVRFAREAFEDALAATFMTARELALKSRVCEKTVLRARKGEPCGIYSARRIAAALGRELADLVERVEPHQVGAA